MRPSETDRGCWLVRLENIAAGLRVLEESNSHNIGKSGQWPGGRYLEGARRDKIRRHKPGQVYCPQGLLTTSTVLGYDIPLRMIGIVDYDQDRAASLLASAQTSHPAGHGLGRRRGNPIVQ